MIAVQVADIAHDKMKRLEWIDVGNYESCRPKKKSRQDSSPSDKNCTYVAEGC
jgi:hypothetical protein